jgi:hypothetical protein
MGGPWSGGFGGHRSGMGGFPDWSKPPFCNEREAYSGVVDAEKVLKLWWVSSTQVMSHSCGMAVTPETDRQSRGGAAGGRAFGVVVTDGRRNGN